MLKGLLVSFFVAFGSVRGAAASTADLEARVPKPVAAPPVPGFEFLYTLNCSLAPAFEIGNGPRGPRTVIQITGGTFEGPKIKGDVLNLGADWLWTDSKGNGHPDTRYGLRTDDGANVYIQTMGSGQEDGLIHLHGLFETGSEKYWWLNNVVAVGILQVGDGSVKIDMWYLKSPKGRPAQ
jgi:hypothetical protein